MKILKQILKKYVEHIYKTILKTFTTFEKVTLS